MSAPGTRALAFGSALLLSLLVAEGALSLLARRSLGELLGARPVPSVPAAPIERGPPADPASDTPPAPVTSPAPDTLPPTVTEPDPSGGDDAIYSLHDDPLVGYVLKRNADLAIYSGTIRSDAFGLRCRPGPPPPDEALRLVVLGDSIAFGFGVNDDQALAARLEARLAELRGPGERPVVCRTVAVPSWNHRAAPAFLLDHWDELRPDIVLYLPCRNDVCDTDGASTAGQRHVVPDPASSDPWLSVSVRSLVQNDPRRQVAGGAERSEADLGQEALFSDVCAESRRRHDEAAQSLARLERLLTARGCRLAVVWNTLSDYTWFLSSRLAQLAPQLPAIVMLESTRPAFNLGFDPHPNAETLDVWARWLAAELVERAWVSRGAGNALPPVPEAYAELRGGLPEAAEFEPRAEQARANAQRLLRPDIEFRHELGLSQVIGGLNPGRTARENVLAILAPQGDTLELELEPLAARLDLYPLDVAVEANGAPLGTVTIRPKAVLTASLPLPEGLDRGTPLEVRLVPERWIVRRLDPAPGSTTPGPMSLDWCRPVRIATRP